MASAGRFRNLVSIEQYDGATWQPYFDWYCAITAEGPGDGAERSFTLEGRWREEWETLAGLSNHGEGYRVQWTRSVDLMRTLLIDGIELPARRSETVSVSGHEVVE